MDQAQLGKIWAYYTDRNTSQYNVPDHLTLKKKKSIKTAYRKY